MGGGMKKKWTSTDNEVSNLINLPTDVTVDVVFNNEETASVSIGDGALVRSMQVKDGVYTFTGNADAILEVEEALTVGSGATAHIQTGIKAGSISTDGTLSLTGSIETASVTVNVGGVLNLSDTTLDAAVAITNSGTINLSGTIDLVGFSAVVGSELVPVTGSGYSTITTEYHLFNGGSSSAANVTEWQIDGSVADGTTSFAGGTLSVTKESDSYYVTSGSVVYDGGADFAKAKEFILNGGTVVIGTEMISDGFILSAADGSVIELGDKELNQKSLGELSGQTTLSGGVGSSYHLGADTTLKSNLALADSWSGTVKMGDVSATTELLDITHLGKDASTIEMGHISVGKLTNNTRAAVTAHSLRVGKDSAVQGNLSIGETLTLGSAENSAVLTVGGSISADRVLLGNAQSMLVAKELQTSGDVITIGVENQEVLTRLNTLAEQRAITLITLEEAYAGTGAVFDASVSASRSAAMAGAQKYFTVLEWDNAKKNLLYQAKANEAYVSQAVRSQSKNGRAGESLLQDALLAQNPQVNASGSDLAALLNSVDAGEMTDEKAAAVAGASTAALGMAFSGDVERQLRAIRNRTTTMGVNDCVINEGMPYFNAWINAEGNRGELDKDGTMAGYTLDSWGGTVGFDVDVNPNLTLGMAVTAMYGDVTVDGPDTLDGDMDTYYISAFARYAKRAWTHTFVATVGSMDSSYERTVRYSGGSYMTKGDTDGTAFGLMYELARTFTLDRDGDVAGQLVANVAYRHTGVGAYTETGRDAALKVDEQTLDTVTFGVGGRMQAVVGENVFNRTSVLEARALAKLDVGDRSSEADVAFLGSRKTATVESAELGAFGVELGAGLSIPVGDEEDGILFFDVSAELRSGYSNLNGTVGYRINF